MKIEFKVTAEQLATLARMFEPYGRLTADQFLRGVRNERVVMSICLEIADVFHNKFKKLSRTKNLFNEKKKHAITLKYYEAHAVAIVLQGYQNTAPDEHARAIATNLLLTLEQKLT